MVSLVGQAGGGILPRRGRYCRHETTVFSAHLLSHDGNAVSRHQPAHGARSRIARESGAQISKEMLSPSSWTWTIDGWVGNIRMH